MAKAGMRRPDPKEPHGTESNRITHIPKNDAGPVPELQGNAKSGKEKAEMKTGASHRTQDSKKRDAKTPLPEKEPEYGVSEMDGGVMLTTSEILDFSEGVDSEP